MSVASAWSVVVPVVLLAWSLPACLGVMLFGCYLILCGSIQEDTIRYEAVDNKANCENYGQGTNILLLHVTDLTATLAGELMILHAVVNRDFAQ